MKKSNRRLANRYLNLLEAALVGTLYGDPPNDTWSGKQYDARARALGHDWPSLAQTIGTMRMRNLRHLCEEAIFNEIPGDLIETGVWRGGVVIFMRGSSTPTATTDASVYVADSFKGLPPPDAAYPADADSQLHTTRVARDLTRRGREELRALRPARRPRAVPRGLVQGHAAQCPYR